MSVRSWLMLFFIDLAICAVLFFLDYDVAACIFFIINCIVFPIVFGDTGVKGKSL